MSANNQNSQNSNRIENGATVQASDGYLGVVENVTQQGLMVRDQSGQVLNIPYQFIASVPNPRLVQLGMAMNQLYQAGNSLNQADSATSINTAQNQRAEYAEANRAQGEVMRIPLSEERLNVGKQVTQLGEVRLHKVVETYEDSIPVELTHDEVDVQRVPVNQPLNAPAQIRYEGDTMIVPVMQEVLVVTKQLMLVEEVRINRKPVTVQQQVRDNLRRERIEVEDTANQYRNQPSQQ